MKKVFFLAIIFGLLASGCGAAAKPAAPTTAAINPSPVASADLNATAAAMSQQTLQALPTPTVQPSSTPVVFTQTPTGTFTPTATATTEMTATATDNPFLLTLTATLGTGTPAVTATSLTVIPFNDSLTAVTAEGAPTGTEYPRTYGTMPPYLPSGKFYLINNTSSDATISLQCTAKDGSATIIEYPVQGTIRAIGPAGNYHYVAWIGGKRYTGDFKLQPGGTINVVFRRDGVEIKASKE